MADMAAQLQPSTEEVLAGLVERVTYHNDENGFCVLRASARGHRDIATAAATPLGWAILAAIRQSEKPPTEATYHFCIFVLGVYPVAQ